MSQLKLSSKTAELHEARENVSPDRGCLEVEKVAQVFFLTNHKAMFGKTKAIIDYFQHSIENAFQ